MRAAATSLRQAGIDPVVISGGSTPSASFTTEVSTELRPGVYVFGDAQQVELGTIPIDQVALTVVATVVSHAGGRVICDAGSKALAADRAPGLRAMAVCSANPTPASSPSVNTTRPSLGPATSRPGQHRSADSQPRLQCGESG